MHCAPLAIGLLGLAGALAPATSAQVFVVDAAIGPGTDYASIAQAVAAVPDGATLRVHEPGDYDVFAVSGKGLNIVGEDRDSVVIWVPSGVPFTAPGIEVADTAAQQTVLLQSLTLRARNPTSVRDCRGPVVFEDLVDAAPVGIRFVVKDSDNVQFHRCAMEHHLLTPGARVDATRSGVTISDSRLAGSAPGNGLGLLPGFDGLTALALRSSRAVVLRSDLVGGPGGISKYLAGILPSGRGGFGVELFAQATLLALGTDVTGGAGAAPQSTLGFAGGGQVPETDGGAGLVVDATSSAYFGGTTPVGGAAGGPAASPGVPQVVAPGGALQVDLQARPSAVDVGGRTTVGSRIDLQLEASPSSPALLLIATDAGLVPFARGSLLARFAATVPVAVPASGRLDVPYTIPASWPLGATTFNQFVTLDPGSLEIWLTHPAAVHVNH